MTQQATDGHWKGRLVRIAPGLANLLDYRPAWFKDDLRAGVSVAAVALPVAVAYAELAGFHPVTGLYACILPMLAVRHVRHFPAVDRWS